ncbi:MAG: hypothetical protein HS113_31000 [Verrucomicrobiales bacterium]|nr:hypothetical protein [Verrucomicrobiales bacterium]
MKTYQATATERDDALRAVKFLSELQQKLWEVRGTLALAGVGTFGMMKEHQFLMRLENRLTKIHKKLASRVRRVRVTPDDSVDALK